MADLATLKTDLETLRKARRTGAREVSIRDRKVTYRSDSEFVAAISATEREIAQAEGVTAPRNIVVRTSRGW